jgi:hypothetical protein
MRIEVRRLIFCFMCLVLGVSHSYLKTGDASVWYAAAIILGQLVDA